MKYVLLVALVLSACAAPQQGMQEATERSDQLDHDDASIDLAPQDADVRTVQLYRGSDEVSLPMYHLGAPTPLTLEFDVLEETGQPLAFHVFHADRNWERDAGTSKFLSTFDRDQILDFSPSITTQEPYVHYVYRFPNDAITFKASGNYILQVTEVGDRDNVLFERPFFVTEQRGPAELRFSKLMRPGNRPPALLPVLQFSPPEELGSNAFDFTTCFVRNGRFTERKCTDRSFRHADALQFELQPRAAFDGRTTYYFLDLSRLTTSGQINGIDLNARPPAAWLDTDYGRFEDTGYGRALHGQSRVTGAVMDVGQPDVQGQYVNVHFSYVPPNETRFDAPIYISGSFNGWREDETYALDWNAQEKQYEGVHLIKQGMYEYRYVSSSAAVQRQLDRFALGERALFTGMVYYADPRLGSDRLLSVHQRVGE